LLIDSTELSVILQLKAIVFVDLGIKKQSIDKSYCIVMLSKKDSIFSQPVLKSRIFCTAMI